MNSRERMLAAMNRRPIDRIPTDIWATPEVWEKLRARFGDETTAMAELHIDGMGSVNPEYVGPALPKMPGDETINYWGMRTKRMAHEGGYYDEQFFYPLAFARSIDDLSAYAWPQADWFNYSSMKEHARVLHESQVVLCGYMAPFFFHNLLRGLEQSLIDPLEDPEFTHVLLGRISDFFYEHHRRMFEACDSLVDVAQVTDDLGTQKGPMISLDLYKKFYAPHHQRFIELCHEFGIKVFHHDDGSNRIFLPTLVEMGIDILNPVQWTCPGMDMEGLKRDFGQRICFHGAVENQRILPFGTPEEVRLEVRHCIDSLAGDGTGYILAPCHNLQVNTPMENIIAMYDEAYHYGRMRPDL